MTELLRATGLRYEEASEDLLRINSIRNIIVASTPSVQRAEKYIAVQELRLADKKYEVTAYAAPPEDTVKGVIHNIPDYDSAEDITRSLVCQKNPTILQARRMGRTNSAIIIFEGNTVPYYIYYRGAEYRCFLHKKRHEVCDACGRLGHRADVCPAPENKICKSCGTKAPTEDHDCELKCALCGRDPATGDKKCPLRFCTPYLLKKRKWEKRQRQENYRRQEDDLRNTILKSPSFKQDCNTNTRDRSSSFPRLSCQDRQSRSDTLAADHSTGSQRRSRSKSRRRSPSTQGARRKSRSKSRNGRHSQGSDQQNKVSWASAVSHSKALPNNIETEDRISRGRAEQESEIVKIKQMLELVLAENKLLKSELSKLKGASDGTTPSSSKSVAPSCNSGKVAGKTGPPKKPLGATEPPQIPILDNSSSDEMEESKSDSPPSKRRAKELASDQSHAPSGGNKYVNEGTLLQFGEKLTETISATLGAKFDALAASIGTQMAALNARVTALEAAIPRLGAGREGCAGPIKATKPYSRPTLVEGTRTSLEYASPIDYAAGKE